jgi:hypothetical protein
VLGSREARLPLTELDNFLENFKALPSIALLMEPPKKPEEPKKEKKKKKKRKTSEDGEEGGEEATGEEEEQAEEEKAEGEKAEDEAEEEAEEDEAPPKPEEVVRTPLEVFTEYDEDGQGSLTLRQVWKAFKKAYADRHLKPIKIDDEKVCSCFCCYGYL